MEDRRRASRERDPEELQLTLRQGARRSSAENLGQGGPHAPEKVSARLFIPINYVRCIIGVPS